MTAKNDNAELQQFYYHPDHLGSSSYISNLDGEVVQHIEYVPFGEVFLEEKNAKWNTPYLFTSKELDRETGLYYFGARYQDPKLGIFISVDPKAEKYKGWSSYAYALNNPVRFVDPTGMSAEDIEPNRKATEGEIYHDNNDNTTYQGNKNGTWTLATELNNIMVTSKPEISVSEKVVAVTSILWNSWIGRKYVSDSYSIGLTSNVDAFIGVGSTPINFTLLTRGKEPGLYFTPTINTSVGDGVAANAGVTFGSGMYSGNPREIQSSFLQGHSVGVSGGLGLVIDASIGASYAPADVNNLSAGGFTTIGGQIGLGIEGSPASLINVQANYQYTPIVEPIFKF